MDYARIHGYASSIYQRAGEVYRRAKDVVSGVTEGIEALALGPGLGYSFPGVGSLDSTYSKEHK